MGETDEGDREENAARRLGAETQATPFEPCLAKPLIHGPLRRYMQAILSRGPAEGEMAEGASADLLRILSHPRVSLALAVGELLF